MPAVRLDSENTGSMSSNTARRRYLSSSAASLAAPIALSAATTTQPLGKMVAQTHSAAAAQTTAIVTDLSSHPSFGREQAWGERCVGVEGVGMGSGGVGVVSGEEVVARKRNDVSALAQTRIRYRGQPGPIESMHLRHHSHKHHVQDSQLTRHHRHSTPQHYFR